MAASCLVQTIDMHNMVHTDQYAASSECCKTPCSGIIVRDASNRGDQFVFCPCNCTTKIGTGSGLIG